MITCLDEVTSTNDLALASAKTGSHGDCWIAESQTSGRGRRETTGARRVWYSPPARNIYMSLLLKPNIAASQAAGLTLAVGVAVCETLKTVGVDVWLKWPNDIFVGTSKLGGILTEAVTTGPTVDAVVVGLGLNVNIRAAEVPEDLQEVMTSLQIETGQVVDRLTLVHPLHGAMLHWSQAYATQGWPGISGAVQRWDRSSGRQVELSDGRVGVARGIDPVGQLRVEVDGTVLEMTTGEVRLCKVRGPGS